MKFAALALASCLYVAIVLSAGRTAWSQSPYATIFPNLVDFPAGIGGEPIGDLFRQGPIGGGTYYGITTSGNPAVYALPYPAFPEQPTLLAPIPVGAPTAIVPTVDSSGSPTALYSMTDQGWLYKSSLTPDFPTLVGSLGQTIDNAGTPQGSLVSDGTAVYGTTTNGGAGGDGIIYRISLDGSGAHRLHDFATGGGGAPVGGLTAVPVLSFPQGVAVTTTMLFGTTSTGGAFGDGTLFEINLSGGGFKVLHDFNGADGAAPMTALTVVGNTVFGTTSAGGTANDGTVFSFNTLDNSFQSLHSFTGADGAHPMAALATFPLVIEEANPPIFAGAAIVGTTYDGGDANKGTLFYMQPDGTFHSLYSFHGPDGAHPMGPIIWTGPFAADFLGTTMNGGADGAGTVFRGSFNLPEPSSVALGLLGVIMLGVRGAVARKQPSR
ncbi:MAG TPA: choice-of-anchor tandem repeat GloVer-containing protein [Pirellulales bacterium]|nr:choice-of-anchor tandem repeat GloVer-containing protein [Pirellulales bacterium]